MKTQVCVPTVSLGFEVAPTSNSKALADAILHEDFQGSLIAMLQEFEGITPTGGADGSPSYVPLTKKAQLLEKHFPLFTLTIGNRFLNIGDVNTVCYATLYVLTDEGYLPWLSRMGMADCDRISSDGAMADAEISAKRRLFAAIGMGADMIEDVEVVGTDTYIDVVKQHIGRAGVNSIEALISEYRRDAGKYGLKNLAIRNAVNVNMQELSQEDLGNLAAYINKKESSSKVFVG